MIQGFFLPNGRPYVVALLLIHDLGVDGLVPLLVDTGSGTTILHAADATNLGVPFGQLSCPGSARGIGGSRQYYREKSTVVLGSDESAQAFDVTIGIAQPENTRITDDLPSLLGRDVLNQLRMEYDHRAQELRFFD
jgi:hypothetical protein